MSLKQQRRMVAKAGRRVNRFRSVTDNGWVDASNDYLTKLRALERMTGEREEPVETELNEDLPW